MKNRAALLLSLLAALAAAALFLSAPHVGARPRLRQSRQVVFQRSGADLTQQKLVWVHNIPIFELDASSAKRKTYGAHYPLALGAKSTVDSAAETIQQAQAQGINGFAVDTFTNLDFIRPFYAAADQNHFLIAPCFDLAGLTGAAKIAHLQHAVEVYCKEAASHPGCARQNGAFVVFMYNNAALPVDTWASLRAALKDEGLNVFWVGDVSVNFNWVSVGVPPSQENVRQQTLKYFPTYDMGYSFTAIPDQYWDTIRGVFAENHKPFAGGMWPGYYRGQMSNKVIHPFGSDALGTALYRGYWRRQIDANLPWTHVSTWNDFAEHTNVSTDTSYNVTRSDLTAWYAAQFKGEPPPFRDARLYVTTPQSVYLNQPGPAEALVLNPTARPVRVTLRLYDGAGAPYGEAVSGVAAPHGQAAVSIPVNVAALPAGRFLRAHAQMGAGGGTMTSAPILVYGTDPPSGSRIPLLYYSVPSTHALPGRIGLTISNGAAHLSAPAGVSPRFVDLLHDQNVVKAVNTAQIGDAVTLDEDADVKSTDDNYVETQDQGLYVERIIDAQDRVGFSDPVYVPASQPAARRYAP